MDSNVFAALPDNLLHLFDTDTGVLTPYPLPGEPRVSQVSCSPWRDAEGRYHLAGRYLDTWTGSYTVARYTVPAGQTVDRFPLDVLPSGLLCWAPDRSDRVLFAGSDYPLYLYDFSG